MSIDAYGQSPQLRLAPTSTMWVSRDGEMMSGSALLNRSPPVAVVPG
ncbi:hypothetical protein [Mycobacterium kansasii]|nr:hypothetical protein [Mycobacterium kansasii]